jgi:hypothetical protein
MTYGISGGGRSAEEAYILATGALHSPSSALGDAVLEGTSVEIKRASSNTLNQVRAVKYIPLVVYDQTSDDWFVVPAHVVVALVSGKTRGQHTENPFESATLSVQQLGPYKVTGTQDLRSATLEAIAAAEDYAPLRTEMQRVLVASKELAEESHRRVHATLRQLGLL